MPERTRRSLSLFAAALSFAACAAVRPEDVPEPVVLPATTTAAADFPGAAAILAGFDLAGEPALRDGDQVLYGVEALRPGHVERFLLRIRAGRGIPGRDAAVATARFETTDVAAREIVRMTRVCSFDLTLYNPHGRELATSRIERTADLFFEESFVQGIRGAAAGDERAETLARLRLLEIAKLLQEDPILHRLLGKAAAIPLDLGLLFRREVSFHAWLDRGAALPPDGDERLGTRFELPFDLYLNDSLLVRLHATVVDPCGPTGVAAGIVALRAQQATDPARQIRMHLLAAARGPQTDFARHGIAVSCGYANEGAALAFSPDGRFVAMPALDEAVAVHDLHGDDPTLVELLRGDGSLCDVAFLDGTTLLVLRPHRLELFDVSAPASAGREPIAVHPVAATNVRVALEVGPLRTCWLGALGGAVERWTFAADPRAAPVVEQARGATPPLVAPTTPGWLLAGPTADEVVVFDASGTKATRCRRRSDGTWEATTAPVERAESRRARAGLPAAGELFDEVAKGLAFARPRQGGGHAFASEAMVSVTGPDGTHVLGRGFARSERVVHGYDPTGRFYAYVANGYRLLVDTTRLRRRDGSSADG